MISSSTWFDHLQESFSHEEFHFKKFCPSVKTSFLSAENVNETPEQDLVVIFGFHYWPKCGPCEAYTEGV